MSTRNNEFVANGIVLQKTSTYNDSISLTSTEIKNAKEGRYAGVALSVVDGDTIKHHYIPRAKLDKLFRQVKQAHPSWCAFKIEGCTD